MKYSKDKSFRILNMYERLCKGEHINKVKLSNDYGISLKTVQRDIEELRAYMAETHYEDKDGYIKYDRKTDSYYIVRLEREWLANEEAVALCKILLESRALKKEEMNKIVNKLIMQVTPVDKITLKNIINNELQNYIPLKHDKDLLKPIWDLSQYIYNKSVIQFYYIRQDGKQSKKEVKPVSILFSEFYFYLIAFTMDDNNKPIVFRVDRMIDTKPTGEHYDIPYNDKFDESEFRKRVQFMYSGELKTVVFEYSGVLEAILDRLPTAVILNKNKNTYTISAQAYGDGIYMWLKSQGEKVKIIN